MGIRSADSIEKQLEADRKKIQDMIASGKKREALELQIQLAKDGAKGLLDLPYQGKKVRDVEEYKDAQKLTEKLLQDFMKKQKKLSTSQLAGLIDFTDNDFDKTLFQAYDVAGVFNQALSGMDIRLSSWFIVGFYGATYELGGKILLSYVNTFPKKNPHTKVGVAVDLVKNRHKIKEISDYFDPFLRNSVDHSQYVVTDFKTGKIESWNTVDGKKTSKREYHGSSVFAMTVRLLFFIVAYHVSYYQIIIKLNNEGALQ